MPKLPSPRWRVALLGVFVAAGAAAALYPLLFPDPPVEPPAAPARHAPAEFTPREPVQLARTNRLTVWWDLPAHFDPFTAAARKVPSNVHPADYAGPASCKQCHQANYEAWSQHPHRWMNALASPETVRGDFSGAASISYRGGTATFARAGSDYTMSLARDGTRREYRVTQTIGSRFYQYYVGRLTSGPEPAGHLFYTTDHVLPFGYWLEKKEWVPTVHVGPELPDDKRPDPFVPPESGRHFAEYAKSCNYCHTTFPLGDMFARRPAVADHAPVTMHWGVHEYLRAARPEEAKGIERGRTSGSTENPMVGWDAEHYAATFGVSCEACHLGSKEHVATAGKAPPRFFPTSPNLVVEGRAPEPGRTTANLNWSCSRCHAGGRPSFAGGMSTWNSVEFSDAARGSCYSQLRCTECHAPHEALGSKWTRPPERDDAVCLKCHEQFRAADRRSAHTHHPAGSTGDRCLNCHMPRINEGLQDVVRTHMIYSPTRADMIEANHPNACNLCHTDRPIDWTLGFLKNWYGKGYDATKVARSYPNREAPVAHGWLKGENESVRLVAADALARTRDPRAVPMLIDALDDPFLLNRQFAAKGLEEMLGVRPADAGYRFYMTRDERAKPIADLRARVAVKQPPPKRE